jgi:hypothetical protein
MNTLTTGHKGAVTSNPIEARRISNRRFETGFAVNRMAPAASAKGAVPPDPFMRSMAASRVPLESIPDDLPVLMDP